jgi:hypothetical protein
LLKYDTWNCPKVLTIVDLTEQGCDDKCINTSNKVVAKVSSPKESGSNACRYEVVLVNTVYISTCLKGHRFSTGQTIHQPYKSINETAARTYFAFKGRSRSTPIIRFYSK